MYIHEYLRANLIYVNEIHTNHNTTIYGGNDRYVNVIMFSLLYSLNTCNLLLPKCHIINFNKLIRIKVIELFINHDLNVIYYVLLN